MVTKEIVIEALRPVQDPELRFSIVDLGLVYDVAVEQGVVQIHMGLTTPFCPFQDELRRQVETAVRGVQGVEQVKVEFIFEPLWSPQKASQEIQHQFVLMGIPLTRL